MVKILLLGPTERALGVDGHVCEIQLVTAGFYAILVSAGYLETNPPPPPTHPPSRASPPLSFPPRVLRRRGTQRTFVATLFLHGVRITIRFLSERVENRLTALALRSHLSSGAGGSAALS